MAIFNLQTKNNNNMKPKFKTQLVQLSKKDIAEQKRFLIQYENLLQKEYNYKDLIYYC